MSIPNNNIIVISPPGYRGNGPPIDLTSYMVADPSGGLDPANPAFTERIFSHALLREGGVLALENLQLKELHIPVRLFAQAQLQQNMMLNPSFEYDAVGTAPGAWPNTSLSSATITTQAVQTGWASSGTQSVRWTVSLTAGSGSAFLRTTTGLNAMPATAGASYAMQAQVNALALTTGATTTLQLRWFNAGGTNLSTTTVATSAATGTYLLSGAAVAPANTAFVQASIGVTGGSGTGTCDMYFDAVMVSADTSAPPYFDGDLSGYQWTSTPGNSASQNYVGRDGVAALVQQINTAVNLPGQTVQWQDQGSSQPTYFDLASGQLDVAYDFRKAGSSWIDGTLRLFCQPLGHTGTMRLLASAAGSGPILMLPVASPPIGDANAIAQVQVNTGAWTADGRSGHRLAVSVLPVGYQPIWGAASLFMVQQTVTGHAFAPLTGGSGAYASQYLRATTALTAGDVGDVGGVIHFAPPPSPCYIGNNRIFTLVRTNCTGNDSVFDSFLWGPVTLYNYPTSSYISGSGYDWQLVDIGVVSIASSLPTQPLWLEFDWIFGVPAANQAAAWNDITALIMLPEANTTFLDSTPFATTMFVNQVAPGATTPQASVYWFDGLTNKSIGISSGGTMLWETTSLQRGALPKIPVGASFQLAIMAMGNVATGANTNLKAPANDTLSASVSVRERFRFSR